MSDNKTSMVYLDELTHLSSEAVALILEKTKTYGPSWKKRGGAGAWFTIVRPWDRLETIVERHGGDVLAAVLADMSGADGSALACVRDIKNYLMLIEAECVAQTKKTPYDFSLISTLVDVGGPTYIGKLNPDGSVSDLQLRSVDVVDGLSAKVTLAVDSNTPGTPEDGGHHSTQLDADTENLNTWVSGVKIIDTRDLTQPSVHFSCSDGKITFSDEAIEKACREYYSSWDQLNDEEYKSTCRRRIKATMEAAFAPEV